MWKSSDSNASQQPNPSVAGFPATPGGAEPSAQNLQSQNSYSMIGKSIVIKGEITASDSLYVNGCVEGSIHAPAHRVTVGKGGQVKADISAREVIIMGEARGKLDSVYRVEIRNEGSFTGDLATQRICIEDGAALTGTIDVRKSEEKKKKKDAPVEAHSALEPLEAAPAAELELDCGESFAALEKVS
jgi:cytoskeletal protein CcmA (bactofilin family)